MPWPTPPQNWEMVTGTWGTDADREESTQKTGGFSIKMFNTAVATKMRSAYIPVERGIGYHISAMVQASANGAADFLIIDAEEYAADKTTLLGTFNVVTTTMVAANTWEWIGNEYVPVTANVQYIRLTIRKTTQTHYAYWDRVFVESFQPGFNVCMTEAQVVGNATWTTIQFDTPIFLNMTYSRSTGPTAGGIMQVETPGHYALAASAQFDAPGAATIIDIRMVQFNGVTAVTTYYYGNLMLVAGAVGAALRVVAGNCFVPCEGLNQGETLFVQVYQNTGGNLSLTASTVAVGTSTIYNHFSAHRVSKI